MENLSFFGRSGLDNSDVASEADSTYDVAQTRAQGTRVVVFPAGRAWTVRAEIHLNRLLGKLEMLLKPSLRHCRGV